MIYVGVDPGFTGAIARIEGDAVDVWDVETIGEKTTKRIDPDAAYLRLVTPESATRVAAVERSWAGSGQGVTSSFRYGTSYGAMVAIVGLCGYRMLLPTPAKWKADMGIVQRGLSQAQKKEVSREAAIRLFPSCRESLKRKKDHNRAESLLLAEWARRHG